MSDLEVLLLVLLLVLLSVLLWLFESKRRRDERMKMKVDSLLGERDRLVRERVVLRGDVKMYRELYELKVMEVERMKREL